MWNFGKYFLIYVKLHTVQFHMTKQKVFYSFSIAQYCQKINIPAGRIVYRTSG